MTPLTTFAVVLVLFESGSALYPKDVVVPGLTKEEQEVLDLTNAERHKVNVVPLIANPKLIEAARSHSKNMAKQDKLEHTLEDKTLVDRLQGVGYLFALGGENIAWNQKTPREVVDSWMASEGHRQNLLNPAFTEIGLGVAANRKGEKYWTQVFAAPRP